MSPVAPGCPEAAARCSTSARPKTRFPPNVKTMINVGTYSLFTTSIINAFLKVYSKGNVKMMMAANEAEALKILEAESAR
jgi:hypothetical protein